MKIPTVKSFLLVIVLIIASSHAFAQGEAKASARLDASKITVGDQARLFIDVQLDPTAGKVQWAAIPDSFGKLEIVEKGKIDTLKQGQVITYRQRLLITGFDSGVFKIPAIVFSIIPNTGNAYMVQTDSLALMVQTVQVDTTKAFKPIKGIIFVKGSWLDYLLYIVGALVFIVLIVFVVLYFVRNKKAPALVPQKPVETLQEKMLKMLNELEAKQLWQKNQVKEYYVELTDIVRNYIEARFHTPALELTTDELLYKAQLHKELQPYQGLLSGILHTADLAKFAKAQPTPMEHTNAMEKAKEFVNTSKPVITETPIEKTI